MDNVNQTILQQFQNSPVLTTLLYNLNEALDPAINIEAFYDMILNVLTAQGYGLDVWGAIVGVGRVLHVGATNYFGFAESTTGVGFGQGPFNSGPVVTENYALSDDAYRQVILSKAAANLWDGSIPQLNNILMSLFGSSGVCYCTDGGDMTMTYTFNFTLTPVQIAIIETAGVLPRPSGVALSIVQT